MSCARFPFSFAPHFQFYASVFSHGLRQFRTNFYERCHQEFYLFACLNLVSVGSNANETKDETQASILQQFDASCSRSATFSSISDTPLLLYIYSSFNSSPFFFIFLTDKRSIQGKLRAEKICECCSEYFVFPFAV